jgi:hypothetical protein
MFKRSALANRHDGESDSSDSDSGSGSDPRVAERLEDISDREEEEAEEEEEAVGPPWKCGACPKARPFSLSPHV